MLPDLMRLGILRLRPLSSLLPCPLYTKGLTSNQKLERAGKLQTSFPCLKRALSVRSSFQISKLNSGCRFGPGGPLPFSNSQKIQSRHRAPGLPSILGTCFLCCQIF